MLNLNQWTYSAVSNTRYRRLKTHYMKKKTAPRPVDKEGLLKIFKQERRPLGLGDLQRVFGLRKEDNKALKAFLKEMMREGLIVGLKNHRFGIPREMNLETGTLWCTRSGNGFVVPDRESDRDIFIPARSIGNAFHGDKVVARVEHAIRGRKEGDRSERSRSANCIT